MEMRKVIRFTTYRPGDDRGISEPETTAIVELHPRSLSARVKEEDEKGIFVIVDAFDVPADIDIFKAIKQATQRAVDRREREEWMAILYYWDVMWLPFTQVISTKDPSPLTVEEISYTLIRLGKHPAYRGQRIIAQAKDGTYVSLIENGTIETALAPVDSSLN